MEKIPLKHTLKHTPGPWEVVGGALATHSVISKQPGKHGDIICDAPSYHHISMENWPANAKLIAATPDLLEACLLAYYALTNANSDPALAIKLLDTAIEKAIT